MEDFGEAMYELFDLSTLITKNRGINYGKSIASDLEKLNRLIAKHGEEITEYHYDVKKGFEKGIKIVTNDLIKGRLLYFKHVMKTADVSITKDYRL